jgi:xanthine phosphoribosyltransferase
VVYARKTKPITMPDIVFMTTAPSHTKKREVELMCSPEYLRSGDRVLIIDDFLATGQTILGLTRIVHAAGCKLVGIGTLVEKTFENGRKALASLNVPVHSLAMIKSMTDAGIEFER